jgi:hypothetical protein
MPIITTAMQSAVGTSGDAQFHIVERGAIERFAEAIGDANAAYPTVAPPTFLRSLGRAVPALPDEGSVPRALDGGSAWSYGPAVVPGDTITVQTTLESVKEREGRMGAMLIADYATTYINQRDELVAKQTNTVIRMAATS